MTVSKCLRCNGAGKIREPCAICGGKGALVLTSWYACHGCGNHRCVACGGAGVDPQPDLRRIRAVDLPA